MTLSEKAFCRVWPEKKPLCGQFDYNRGLWYVAAVGWDNTTNIVGYNRCMGILKINGKDKQFPDNKMPATIADLLRHLGVDSTTVVAELDGQIIERANFSKTTLNDGQNIELVRFVPGG